MIEITIDFGKMLEEEFQEKPINPLEIHQGYRNKKYEYLRGGQEHVLETWFDQRNQRDTIVKMNTGSGKTLVGLLMLQSCLNENLGPALYLCIDKQLVEQVVETANECGIPNVTFQSRKIPIEFSNSESILITTFDKLVNGMSKFGVKDTNGDVKPIGSLLIDDAHNCLKKARRAFTISLDRNKNSILCERLFDLFKNALSVQAPGKLKDLEDQIPFTLMMVPYWSWLDSEDEIINLLSEYRYDDEIKFQWNLLRDNLDGCYCFISDRTIEITPQCIPIEYIPSFQNAKRRFFLSATLLDDSYLIKEFDVSYEAVTKPLKPKISGDIGERMIIVPRLVDNSLNEDKIVQLIVKRLNENNVVALTSSSKNAMKFKKYKAEIAKKDSIIRTLKKLEESTSNFVVLVNRYDGIDLPDTSCRILVIDGKPFGISLFERFIGKTRPNSRLINSTLAQKIEQGLGRGVRSGADYCVVVLIGDDLVHFLSLTENQHLLSPQTRVQIEMGLEFGKQLRNKGNAEEAVLGLMDQCLNRDSAWIKYHHTKVQKAGESPIEMVPITLADLEKKAFKMFQINQYREASNIIQSILDIYEEGRIDNVDIGWYLQLAAFYKYKFDRISAMEMQLKAHKLNTLLSRPPEGVDYRKIQIELGKQSNRIIEWIQKYTEANALIISANYTLDKISFGIPYETFEEEFAKLAKIIGFQYQRPEKEYGKGPDVLWQLSDGTYLIISAKNEATSTSISKKYADNLSGSMNWFDREYPDAVGIPVMVHPSNKLAFGAYCVEGAMALKQYGLRTLVSNIRSFTVALASKSPDSWNIDDVNKLVHKYNLDPKSIKEKYFVKISKK